MDNLTFYHQKRRDGGIRTGIEHNGERVLESFCEGGDPPDSVLEWFVEVRCSAKRLPGESEDSREFFLRRADAIVRGLNELANEVSSGIDKDWPAKWEVVGPERIQILCSAQRRISGIQIAQILRELAVKWPKLLRSLDAYHAFSH
jgi:hypothetical protein